MSGIAGLYNVPTSQAELWQWSFIHAAHHADINRRIAELLNTVLVAFVLDPFDPNNIGQWAAQHQIMHQNQDELLGISGYDLSEPDFLDLNNSAGWIYLNGDEHRRAADLLGIG